MWRVKLRSVQSDGRAFTFEVVLRDSADVCTFWRTWCRLVGLTPGALDWYPDTIVGVIEEGERTVSLIADRRTAEETE